MKWSWFTQVYVAYWSLFMQLKTVKEEFDHAQQDTQGGSPQV